MWCERFGVGEAADGLFVAFYLIERPVLSEDPEWVVRTWPMDKKGDNSIIEVRNQRIIMLKIQIIKQSETKKGRQRQPFLFWRSQVNMPD